MPAQQSLQNKKYKIYSYKPESTQLYAGRYKLGYEKDLLASQALPFKFENCLKLYTVLE